MKYYLNIDTKPDIRRIIPNSPFALEAICQLYTLVLTWISLSKSRFGIPPRSRVFNWFFNSLLCVASSVTVHLCFINWIITIVWNKTTLYIFIGAHVLVYGLQSVLMMPQLGVSIRLISWTVSETNFRPLMLSPNHRFELDGCQNENVGFTHHCKFYYVQRRERSSQILL